MNLSVGLRSLTAGQGGGPPAADPLTLAAAFWPLSAATAPDGFFADVTGHGHDLPRGDITSGEGPDGGFASGYYATDADTPLALGSALVAGGSFTVSGWVKGMVPATLWGQTNGLAAQQALYCVTGFDPGLYPTARVSASADLGGNPFSGGFWRHLAVTFDGSFLTLFYNGSSQAQLMTHAVWAASDTRVARVDDVGEAAFALVGVYPFLLSESQIGQLYNAGFGFNPFA